MGATGLTVVRDDMHSAGVITWWRLSGDVSIDELADAWVARGLDALLLPEAVSGTAALKRALHTLYTPDLEVRPVPGGYALLRVTYRDDTDDPKAAKSPIVHEEFKVWLRDGIIQVSKSAPANALTRIFRAHQDAQRNMTGHDLSVWLVSRVEDIGAVRLREGGGVYFVPSTSRETWDKVCSAIETVSKCRLYQVPALQNDAAVRAIFDSLEAEVTAAAARIQSELDTGELGSRAIDTRRESAKRLLEKVQAYEQLLESAQPTMQEMLQTLHARLAEAALAAP